ncbi:hypothetical protein ACIHEJ_11525 [Streptomyces sp. NPDC052301]|uniref:hypothetical protein n=1 Tax=Streptomyces sp. NPDC052301 TaxID=3365687 RepID=UPI0037CFD489
MTPEPPRRLLRHYHHHPYVASDGGSDDFDSTMSGTDDVGRVVSPPWALRPPRP